MASTNYERIKRQRQTVSDCLTAFHQRYADAEKSLHALEDDADGIETQDYATRLFDLQCILIDAETRITEYTATWDRQTADLGRA